MTKISLLIPTRKRPENIKRLWDSLVKTTFDLDSIELVLAVDDDDDSYDGLGFDLHKYSRTVLSQYWNHCFERAKGDICMHAGDDLVFKTTGWDLAVLEAFEEVPDKILFVHGDDGSPNGKTFGTHGFIHRNWVEAVGYFVPPYFSSDYNDTWLNSVAHQIGRYRYIDIYYEHMHPAWGKAKWDATHNERLARHKKDKVEDLYASKAPERLRDAEKLKAFIGEFSASSR